MKKSQLQERRRIKMIFLEHAVAMNKLQKFDTFLSDSNNYKKNIDELNKLIVELKNEIKKLEYFDIDVISKQYDNHEYICDFSTYANNIIKKIKKFLSDNENDENFDKYVEIIFPEGYERTLLPNIEIETDNFNRIHIGDIAKLIRQIGVATKIYKTMVKKLGYISSIGQERTKDAELIWNSIIKDKNIYSFICDKKIISFSNKLELEKILSTLKKFFKYEIETKQNEIIMDDDFIEKYNIDKL